MISETLDRLAELGIVRAHRVAMQWCSQRLAATRTSFSRLIAWLAGTRIFHRGEGEGDEEAKAGSSDAAPERPRRDSHLVLDVPDPRVRFQNAVRAVIKLQRTTGKRPAVRPGLPRRDSWWQTPMSSEPETASPVPEPGLFALRGARVAKVIEELKAFEMAHEVFPHGALVRHLQFSPNGRYLATSR